MDYILNDYLDTIDSAEQYDVLMSMAQDFQFEQEFGTSNSNVEQFNDLPF